MTPSRANLKTLVQCRPLWFWHFWGACVCIPPLVLPLGLEDYRPGALAGILIVPLWSGVMSAGMFKDFASKPFSFGLPGHQLAWRRTLFTLGLVVSASCAFLFTLAQAGAPGVVAAAAWQAFLWCLAAYLAGALLATSLPNTSFVPALLTVLLLVVLGKDAGARLRVAVEAVLLASPVVTAAACVSIVAIAWRMLGSRGTARKLCGEPFMPLHTMWSGKRQVSYNAHRKLKLMRRSPGIVMEITEAFFLSRMRSLAHHPTIASMWGALYMSAGRAAPARATNVLWAALGLVTLTGVLGFYHPHHSPPGVSGANLLLLILCAIGAEYRINPNAALLLNVSRRSRFASLLLAALAQLLAVALMSAAVIGVSYAVRTVLPEATILGKTSTYDPIVPKALFFFLALLPFYYLVRVLFPKQIVIFTTVVTVIGVIVFISTTRQLLEMTAPGILLLLLACWLPFVALLYRYCRRWDLDIGNP
jgi:hypothetical protein